MESKNEKRKRPVKDRVIKEMDVYLCSSLYPKLHVFNFPPGFDPLATDKTNLLGVKVKLESKRFMMDVKIDAKSRNFDKAKSEQIADHGDEPFFSSKYMDKLILKSNEAKPANLQYAVGVLKHDSDEIHLTPINSVIQFTPSFDYFDHKEKKDKKETPGSAKGGIDSSGEGEEKKEEDAKKVLVRFERPDEEKLKKAREASFSFIKQKIANEPWTDINVSLRDSTTAMIEKQNLFFHQASDEFLNNFNGPDVLMAGDQEAQSSNMQENSISCIEEFLKPLTNTSNSSASCLSALTKQKNITLSNKIHRIMMSAKVVSFTDLKNLLSDVSDQTLLIRNIQKYAVTVQGNWVIKSEFLYPQENGASTTSPLTGIPKELLCRARDFILWSFSQGNSVSRPEIIEKTKIPPEEILNILKETARFSGSDKRWHFMLPTDNDFIEKYPEVVHRENLFWEARIVQVSKAYSAQKVKPRKHRKSSSSTSSS